MNQTHRTRGLFLVLIVIAASLLMVSPILSADKDSNQPASAGINGSDMNQGNDKDKGNNGNGNGQANGNQPDNPDNNGNGNGNNSSNGNNGQNNQPPAAPAQNNPQTPPQNNGNGNGNNGNGGQNNAQPDASQNNGNNGNNGGQNNAQPDTSNPAPAVEMNNPAPQPPATQSRTTSTTLLGCQKNNPSRLDCSSLEVSGHCENGIAIFTIRNTGSAGDGDMVAATSYRLIVDGQVIESGNVQLTGGQAMTVTYSGGGTVWLEADQQVGHPGNSHPRASVNCGGSVSTPTPEVTPPDDILPTEEVTPIPTDEVIPTEDVTPIATEGVTPPHLNAGAYCDTNQQVVFIVSNSGGAMYESSFYWLEDINGNLLLSGELQLMESESIQLASISDPGPITLTISGMSPITLECLPIAPTEEVTPTEEITPAPTDEVIPTEEITPSPTEEIIPTEEVTPIPTEDVIPPALNAGAYCDSSQQVIFIISNSGGDMPDAASYVVFDLAGNVILSGDIQLMAGETLTLSPVGNAGSITLSVAGATAVTLECLVLPTQEVTPTEEITPQPTDEVVPTEEITPSPTEEITPQPTEEVIPTEEVTPVPTDEVIPPALNAGAYCDSSQQVIFIISNSGGDMLEAAAYTVTDNSGNVVLSGEIQLMAGETITLSAISDAGTMTLSVAGLSTVTLECLPVGVTPEVTPTEEITPSPTEEVTPAPTEEVTPVPTQEVTPSPTPDYVRGCQKNNPARLDCSTLSVRVTCQDGAAVFTITNGGKPGEGDMVSATEYRIIVDGAVVETGTILLAGHESMTVTYSGKVTLIADQQTGHPGSSQPQASANCG